ncbi:MAG: TraR/DksA family transcriptional regulator [Bryobacteraceae bacterium]
MNKRQPTAELTAILNRRRILEERLDELTSRLIPRDELQVEILPDALDQVQSNNERELSSRRLDTQSRLIRELRAALKRMDQGVYGVCEDCEEPIPSRRLDAMPFARLCIRCQEHAEAQRQGDDAGFEEEAA